MKKLWKSLALATSASALLFSLSACGSNGNKSSGDEKDGKSVTILTEDHSDVRPKSKDLWMWKEYEKMSGVKVDWTEVKDFGEKKNLLLSKKELPDAFYQTIWTNDEVVKYGTQGIFQPLEKLIPKYAPNLNKIMKKYPDVKKAMTTPDGHIYSLPYLSMDPMSGGRTFRLYINQKWLDKLGLEVPKTTEELKEVLTQFVTKDPNGNGKADEQGWYMNSGELPNSFEKIIDAAYGLDTAGRTAIDNMIYLDNDKLQLTVNSDKMKDVWKYENDLYSNKLIFKQAFAGVDSDKWVADASKDVVGLWSWVSPEMIGEAVRDNYTPINIIEGPNGDKGLVSQPPIMGTSAFMITKDAKDPKELLKWVDYFYSEEGSEFGFLGKEGVTYHVVDGKKVYVDKILNYDKGAQLGSYQYMNNVYAGFFPYLELPQKTKEEAWGEKPIEYTDFTDADVPKQLLPDFMSTPEESSEISTIMTDMRNYVEQARVKFVTGKWNFTTDWDNYVTQLNKIGADRLLKIRRTQYARYQKN
ncbi:extracellular solute-binding protein [Lapidilactobacillus achengensis]|uniref:Extracellular solute-binding protein n=1 Tax=Lapidilactobacillus achengensis TaxID=2486000 RepID=A0ABW1UQN7_9LACO|nr:extracellular solute-binding protein [Lapidilactobacillus achengensis]